MRVRVIGVGTRNGADGAGLDVLELLSTRALPGGVTLAACERPLPDLLDSLAGAEAAVIVDAARGVGPGGGARRLACEELARPAATSSHGFGVAQTLALAAALGRAPRRVEVVAIEAGRAGALDAGAALVLDLVRALASEAEG
jgi:hydrogenase maturation protease